MNMAPTRQDGPGTLRSEILALLFLSATIHALFCLQVFLALPQHLGLPGVSYLFGLHYLTLNFVPSPIAHDAVNYPALGGWLLVSFPVSAGYALLVAWLNRRRVRPGTPNLSWPVLGRVLLAGLVFNLTFQFLLHAAGRTDTTIVLLRLFAGALSGYALGDFLVALMQFWYLAAGLDLAANHRNPIASRSLREFWGQRWNHKASLIFHRIIYSPLARRRHPALGIFCAFFVSGVFHAAMVAALLASEPGMVVVACMMAVFFVVQGLFVLVEARLRVEDWSVPARRAWTLGILLATSPLFFIPCLRAVRLW